MRILHSIHSVNPAIGGPIAVVRQLIALHQQFGHEVDVVSLDDPAAPFVRDFPTRLYALGPSMPGYGYTHRYLPWLQSMRNKYDVVVVNGLWQYTAFGVWLTLRGSSTPYVVFPHGMLDPWFKHAYPLKHIKKSIYWALVERHVLEDAHAVLFTAEDERLNARRSFAPYPCNEMVIGYGIADPVGDSTAQKELFFAEHPHLRQRPFLLFLGRIHKKKGCDLLLRSCVELTKSHADLHIVMCGPDIDNYGKRLRRKFDKVLAGRITWTGMLVGDIKWGAIRACDALVLPSHQENFGVAVVEAMACGKPVLISNKVNIFREILKDKAGLVAEDTFAGTQHLLCEWLGMTGDDRLAMGRRARQCFLDRFQIHLVYDRLMRVLEQAVSDGSLSKN